jgi:hypothetical protein
MSLFTLTVAFFFSRFSVFFSFPATLIAFFLTFDLGFFTFALFPLLLLLGDATLLLFNSLFFGTQLGPDSFAFISPGLSSCSVFFVRLRSTDPLRFGGFVADVCAPDFTNALFDSTRVYKLSDDRLRFLVEAGPLERAIKKRCGFAAVEGEQLLWIFLDFLLSDLEYSFRDLRLVVLGRVSTHHMG